MRPHFPSSRLAVDAETSSRQHSQETGLAEAARLTGPLLERMNARLDILNRFTAFQQERSGGLVPLREAFVEAYNSGSIGVQTTTRKVIARLSLRSLFRWEKLLRENGPAALAGSYGSRSARTYRTALDKVPGMREAALGMIAGNPHVNAVKVRTFLQVRFRGEAIPSLRSIRRFIERWRDEHVQLALYLSNPDKWRSQYGAAFGDAAAGVVALNQVWELDSSPADVLLEDGRYSLIACIDVWSRRLHLHLARTSSAAGIASTVRHCVSEWGVPGTLKTDNGKDYTGHHIQRVAQWLGVSHQIVPPFQPDAKPFVERAFRTFSHDLLELLPAFVGHNVSERQAIRNRRSFADRMMQKGGTVEVSMKLEEFESFVHDWLTIYNAREHSALGMSPLQRAAGWDGEVRRIANERALDFLLLPAPNNHGKRTVRKKGLQIAGEYYVHERLVDHMGETVLCLYDEADIARVLVFGGPNGDFLCIASCEALGAGIDRKSIAAAARRRQARYLREAKAEMSKIAAQHVGPDAYREIVDELSRQAARITPLTQATETETTTPELDAAARAIAAADALDAPREMPEQNDEATRTRIHQLRTEEAERTGRRMLFDSEFDRYSYLKFRTDLTEEETAFVTAYRERLYGDAEGY